MENSVEGEERKWQQKLQELQIDLEQVFIYINRIIELFRCLYRLKILKKLLYFILKTDKIFVTPFQEKHILLKILKW